MFPLLAIRNSSTYFDYKLILGDFGRFSRYVRSLTGKDTVEGPPHPIYIIYITSTTAV